MEGCGRGWCCDCVCGGRWRGVEGGDVVIVCVKGGGGVWRGVML